MRSVQPTTGITIFYRDLNSTLFAAKNSDFDSLESSLRIAKLMQASGRFITIIVMEGRYSSLQKKILTTIHYEIDYQ